MINANKEKLASFFQGNTRYAVPFFQRPYVWDEENWSALWEHALSVLERYEEEPKAEHFIGTLITKERPAQHIGESMNDLIDGQQRLTTIAVLLKAIGDSSSGDMPNFNDIISAHLGFKDAWGNIFTRLIHCRYDQPYFSAVMAGDISAVMNNNHKIIRAYRFFQDRLEGFSDEKLNTLRLVVLEKIPVISMMLSPDDDEQEIFDTINALGVRLTTGELLKNYIFKESELQDMYPKYWEEIFEENDEVTDFWNLDKTAGRIIRTNIEVLLYCYLVIKTGKEVKLESLFKEYKIWLSGKSTEEKRQFLEELKEYASYYFLFPSGSDLNQIAYREHEKRFFHLVENLMITTVYPLVLYLYKNVKDGEAHSALLQLLESYLVRRNICRFTTKNYNQLFVQIISGLEKKREASRIICENDLRGIIDGFNDPSNKMPIDSELRIAFREEILSNQNAREILFCIALYQVATEYHDLTKLSSNSYSVEHMMPVKWETNWLCAPMTAVEKAERDKRLRTLGNLTLVTQKLNAKMQNAGWTEKKEKLRQHSALELTKDYLELPVWNEAAIQARAEDLVSIAKIIWKG